MLSKRRKHDNNDGLSDDENDSDLEQFDDDDDK